jgi:hypothetical protein
MNCISDGEDRGASALGLGLWDLAPKILDSQGSQLPSDTGEAALCPVMAGTEKLPENPEKSGLFGVSIYLAQ